MPNFDYDAAFANVPKSGEPGVGPVVLTLPCVLGNASTPTNTLRVGKAGAMGALLSGLVFIPLAAIALDGVAYLFVSADNGLTKKLIASQKIPQQSPSASVAPIPVVFPYSESNAWRLEANEELYVGASVAAATAAGIVVDARRSDLMAV
jgi:hypothetical protein